MGKKGIERRLFLNKTGQITIFVIIAVVIVAIGILVYVFYPQLSSTFGTEQDPMSFIQASTEDEITDVVELISLQGGSIEPSNSVMYDNNIAYLVYSNNYCERGAVQVPFLEYHIESQIKDAIESDIRESFNEMKRSFEERGYTVTMREGDIGVDLLPERILLTFNYSATFERTETQKYESFTFSLNNNLYELIGIANNIIDWESNYGDTEVDMYMRLYPNLNITKARPDFGTRVYIIQDRNTGSKFQFASRSLVDPPGYGFACPEV